MARRDKLWSFCVFCHPEAAGTMTCRDKLWSFHTPFCHLETIESDGTQRQIMVILRLLSSRGGKPNDMRRQIMVIPHTFLPSRDDRVQWHAETNYGHSSPFVIQRRRARRLVETNYGYSHTFLPSRDDRVQWHAETNYGHSAPFVIQRRQAR